jgi:Transposase DDE domain group 1
MLYPIESLIAQRIYGLVMGYEDLNDHEELRHDPMFALALQKRIGLENEPVNVIYAHLLNKIFVGSDKHLSLP